MSIIGLLVPVSLVLVALGVWAFFWAVREGQFEELDVAAWEILIEERPASEAQGGPASAPACASPPSGVAAPLGPHQGTAATLPSPATGVR